jgi:1-acyl-sn-glycerol-3-phosphate acyltransferase
VGRGRNDRAVRTARIVSRIALTPFFSLETEGTENLPRKNAFVLLPKHQRWEDIPLVGLAASRPLYYVAKYELFRDPVSTCFLKSLGGISLNRKNPLKSRHSLNNVIELLRKGEGVVVFPEGTYYRNTMGPGRPGMIRLILSRLDLPFIPTGISYSRRRYRTEVRIKFGNPLYADSKASVNEFMNRMMTEIARLSGLGESITLRRGEQKNVGT